MQVLKVLLVTTTLVDATDDENTSHISGHKHTHGSETSGEPKKKKRGAKASFLNRANEETLPHLIPDSIANAAHPRGKNLAQLTAMRTNPASEKQSENEINIAELDDFMQLIPDSFVNSAHPRGKNFAHLTAMRTNPVSGPQREYDADTAEEDAIRIHGGKKNLGPILEKRTEMALALLSFSAGKKTDDAIERTPDAIRIYAFASKNSDLNSHLWVESKKDSINALLGPLIPEWKYTDIKSIHALGSSKLLVYGDQGKQQMYDCHSKSFLSYELETAKIAK